MGYACRHDRYRSARGDDLLTADRQMRFSLQDLDHGVKRGCMLAQGLALVKGKQGQGPGLLIQKRLADNRGGGGAGAARSRHRGPGGQ